MEKVIIDPKALEALKGYQLPKDLSFGMNNMPIMIESDYENGKWSDLRLVPWAPIMLYPNAKVFHYGQEIFEGLKAYKHATGKVNLFRPDKNAERFNKSALRMAMPTVPVDRFVESCRIITSYCAPYIPAEDGCSLYMRPFMIATTEQLKINASEKYKYLVIASPSGSYFQGEGTVRLLIEREGTRASSGGMGFAKTGGNYAQSLQAQVRMKKLGYDQIIWLDAIHKRYIEELSGMNFCAVIKGEIVTPQLTDTILDGVTRDSLLTIAKEMGVTVRQSRIDINELCRMIETGEATEAFACGTAAIVAPVSSISELDGREFKFQHPKGKIGAELRRRLLAIQNQSEPCPFENWIVNIQPVNT